MERSERPNLATLDLINQGDADALQQVIVARHDKLQRAVAGAMPTWLRSRVDADDVLQQAYVAAFRDFRRRDFGSERELHAWLRTVAVSQAQEQVRLNLRQKRDKRREVGAAPRTRDSYVDWAERLSAGDGTPSGVIRRQEAVAVMTSCLARLPEDQRRALCYRVLEGRSVAEVAMLLERSEAAVHGLCARGLRRLRELMGPRSHFFSRD